jgi:rhodanese-related sulfurtransferase
VPAQRRPTAFFGVGVSTPQQHQTLYENQKHFFNKLFAIQSVGSDKMKDILDDFEVVGRNDSGYCVLDVRNPDEVEATGKLSPSVVTFPLPLLEEGALSLSEADFEAKYGFAKPSPDETLVLTCAAGKRAQKAAEKCEAEGYPKLVVYTGGAREWFAL